MVDSKVLQEGCVIRLPVLHVENYVLCIFSVMKAAEPSGVWGISCADKVLMQDGAINGSVQVWLVIFVLNFVRSSAETGVAGHVLQV